MRKWTILISVVMILALLLACGEQAPKPPLDIPPGSALERPEATDPNSSGPKYLTPNPVEESQPIYGSYLRFAVHTTRSFDSHQRVGYGPTATLPVFNQLVMFNIDYKDTVLENIIGDLADSWETSEDGTEIIFHLHPGVKWHDGVPFTADDVIYSLDKMTDVNRSAISGWFPAYESSEKIDDNTVKVHLKYASGSFMLMLAAGESQIQAKHLAGTDGQSGDFMVGTGPFMLEEYLIRVHIKYKRNPDYWKYDRYGNQLPYLDGIVYYTADSATSTDMLVGRRLDMRSTTTGAATTDTYEYLRAGAPELIWQRREKELGTVFFLNLNHPPLDDVRVRRAMGLLIDEEALIIGYCGDARFGIINSGLLPPSFGLPKEEIMELMGWDKPMDERVAEAQRLMTEAGYPNGFNMEMLALGASKTQGGAALVFAEELRTNLNITSEVASSISQTELFVRLDDDRYDLFAQNLRVELDPAQLQYYAGTGSYANYAHYSSPEVDRLLAELDYVIDPDQRREAVWEIERILLTDLPMLPTGCFIANLMPYYPHVKNARWTDMSYSNICRLEDVWIDESLR
jgi:peptide/nickel transport system substrate-binding protein